MKKIGSQLRETLKESGYKLVGRPGPGQVILQDEDGKKELWYANDHHAGYTVQVGRWGYEFGRDWKETEVEPCAYCGSGIFNDVGECEKCGL